MKNSWKKTAAFVLAFTLVAAPLTQTAGKDGLFGGTTIIAHAADEVSENISLVASDSSNLKTISGTHYSVSCGYMSAGSSGMQVCKAGAMTINARKGETITKVVLTYNWGNNKSSLSASSGTFDGNATISGINAQQVTISSSNTAGVKISAVTVYFEGSLSNPTVTLTGGANAKSSGGLLTQSYLPGAMDTVTYTAITGAAFPEFETFTQNGVTVERTSDTVVTVSGTPTANTAITVPDAESSSKIVTWDSSIINASGRNGIGYQIRLNNSYSDTANGITLTKSGSGYASLNYGDWMTSGDVTLNFTTATGKFTSIEIEASQIYDGGNWTKDGNTLKWNGTPSNSVSLSGSGLYLEGVSSINFVIEMPADLSNATVTLGADNTVSSVTVGGNEITDLSEFDITYGTDESHTATEPPTEDGTYYAYVTAKSTSENYTGTAKSEAFTVVNAITLTADNVTIADFTYDGTEKTPVLKYGETTLLKDTDYELLTPEGDTASATNAGTYTIHINGKGDYAGENIALTWKINKADVNVTADAKSKKYGEDDPVLTYTAGALFGTDAFTGALARAEGEAVNTYAITQGTLSAGDNYNINFTGADFTINKADSTPDAVTGLTAAFGKTLADVTLPDGWAWDDALTTSVGDVGENTFSATFTPTDTANYNPLTTDLTVNVTAIPAAPTAVGTLNATYGDTLADVDLPTPEDGTWAWKDAGTTSVGNAGEQTFKAVFTPSSPNYTAVEQDVTINVAKADPTPDAVTGLTVAYGKKLSDVTLPDGWAWDAPATSVGNVGNNPFAATYTPTDTDNYNTLNQNLTVNVVAVDKTSLNEAIAAANTYLATIQKTVYADPALALISAITDANAISTNDNVTEAQVAQAIIDMNNAVTTAKAAVKDIDDTKAAQAVTDKINALPAAENIKSTDKEAVEAARAAYANLTEAQSAKVTKATTDKLTAAEKAVADRIAADAVIEKINAISEVVLTNESKALIDAARTAYEALATDAQKALVSNYTTLTADEQKYSDLQVADVKAKIDAIGDIELTDESKAAIDTARAAFKALNADQQALVANAKILDYAEKLYEALDAKDKADKDKAAAEKSAAEALDKATKAETDKAAAETEAAKALDNAAKAAEAQAKAEAEAAAAKAAQATAEKAAADAKTAQTKAEEDAAAAKAAQATAEKAAADAKTAQTKAEEDAAAAKAAQATAEKNAEAANSKVSDLTEQLAAAVKQIEELESSGNVDEALKKQVAELKEQLDAAKTAQNEANEALAKAQDVAAAKIAAAEAAQEKAEEEATAAEKAQATAEQTAKEATEKAAAAEKAQATAEQTAKEATEKAAAAEEAQKVAEAAQAEAEKKAAEDKAAADQAAADKVIKLIDAIGNVEKTNTSENKIVAARAAYDALTDEQKALVTNYTVLTKAESAYKTLPQTGMSGFHKVFAGLAALMGITGMGLIKKSRKEDEEE